MPWVVNYDMASVYNGYCLHRDTLFKHSVDPVVIQIFDIGCRLDFPKDMEYHVNPSDRHQFEFLDIDPDFECFEECCIKDEDAMKIADIIKEAKNTDRNILVHCFAGVARSGAVVQAAVDYGFFDRGVYRAPNEYVLQSIKKYI